MGIGNKGDLPWPYIEKDSKHFDDLSKSTVPFSFSKQELSINNLIFNSNLK